MERWKAEKRSVEKKREDMRRLEERKRESQKKEDTGARNVRKDGVSSNVFSNDLWVGRAC